MDQLEEPPRTSKALLAAVIGMGVLIVAGTVTLVGVIIHRMNSHPAPPALPAALPLQDATPEAAPPTLPAGTRLLSVTRVQDGLLALHVTENGQDKILLWQVNAHKILQGLSAPAPAP
ncbi:MAG: DUF6476 family protein [Acetobacter cibinongensis]